MSTVYSFSERLQIFGEDDPVEEIKNEIDCIIEEAQQLADEQREKKDNMPEPLQDADIGQLLEDRADQLEQFISELEGVDADIDDEDRDAKQNLLDELAGIDYQGE